MEYKRTLIISNNALSSQKNNGKTIESFFANYPSEKIAQLYFSEEIPDSKVCNNFFKISDIDILKRIIRKKNEQKEISSEKGEQISVKKSEITRLVREIMWRKCVWNTQVLNEWIKEFQPEVIFFCGGDSGFAYTITNYIQKITSAKLVLFITDDYILNKASSNIFYLLRTRYIEHKIRKCISSTDKFITISDKMGREYEKYLGIESETFLNMSEELPTEKKTIFGEPIIFTYMGGFSYNRYKVLLALGEAMAQYNGSHNHNLELKIFSNDTTSTDIIESLKACPAITYGGRLDAAGVKIQMEETDVLVHVESFDAYCKAKTSLSISTKIPEYLSSKRLILAIGPDDIASMEYLKNVAYCINSENVITQGLIEIMQDEHLRDQLIDNAINLYNTKHNPNVVRIAFEEMINGL